MVKTWPSSTDSTIGSIVGNANLIVRTWKTFARGQTWNSIIFVLIERYPLVSLRLRKLPGVTIQVLVSPSARIVRPVWAWMPLQTLGVVFIVLWISAPFSMIEYRNWPISSTFKLEVTKLNPELVTCHIVCDSLKVTVCVAFYLQEESIIFSKMFRKLVHNDDSGLSFLVKLTWTNLRLNHWFVGTAWP